MTMRPGHLRSGLAPFWDFLSCPEPAQTAITGPGIKEMLAFMSPGRAMRGA